MTEVSIEGIQIATSEKFTDPVYIIPVDAPVSHVISSNACLCALTYEGAHLL